MLLYGYNTGYLSVIASTQIPISSSTPTKLSNMTTQMTSSTLTSTQHLMSQTTSQPTSQTCIDASFCSDPNAIAQLCADDYSARKFCPKTCGHCCKCVIVIVHLSGIRARAQREPMVS